MFRARPGSRRYRPSLESLEDRCLPATPPVTATGHAGTAPVSRPAEIPSAAPVLHVRLTYAPGLTADVFFPPGFRPRAQRVPAIAFFHGGGLAGGWPRTWYPASRYFARRGLVAISFQYRSDGLAGAALSVADARLALRWMRTFSAQLGIDPNAIVAAGDSAGGYLALMTALGKDQPGEPFGKVPSTPNAVVAFYPILDGVAQGIPQDLSPLALRQTRPLPPTLIVEGTEDQDVLTPYATAVTFCADLPNCLLFSLPGRGHAFLVRPRDRQMSLAFVDEFLERLGGG